MIAREEFETMLSRLNGGAVQVKEVATGGGVWVVAGIDDLEAEVIATYAPPVAVLRVNVMDLPPGGRQNELLRRLLELNATDLVHGSYGIEGAQVVLTAALELEHLDQSELQASFDSLTLALASHLAALASYR
jgi:Tir chaperone family protein CesT